MRTQSLLPALAVMASTAQAATNYLVNHCAWDVYFTQDGGKGPMKEPQLLSAGDHTTVSQFFTGTGTSIKFTKTIKGLWNSAPVLQFVYTYEAGKDVYYGIAMDQGYDYNGEIVILGGHYGSDVEEIIWNGRPGPAYTAEHNGETDLVFTLCAKLPRSASDTSAYMDAPQLGHA